MSCCMRTGVIPLLLSHYVVYTAPLTLRCVHCSSHITLCALLLSHYVVRTAPSTLRCVHSFGGSTPQVTYKHVHSAYVTHNLTFFCSSDMSTSGLLLDPYANVTTGSYSTQHHMYREGSGSTAYQLIAMPRRTQQYGYAVVRSLLSRDSRVTYSTYIALALASVALFGLGTRL